MLFALAVFFACDIGSFPAATPLHPPLGLALESTNQGEIQMEFWAFNDEEAFSGYNIYMAQNEADVQARETNNCLRNNIGAFPSIREGRSSDVQLRKYSLDRSPSGALLQSGETWYITVSSYDGYTATDSLLGEIKSVLVY